MVDNTTVSRYSIRFSSNKCFEVSGKGRQTVYVKLVPGGVSVSTPWLGTKIGIVLHEYIQFYKICDSIVHSLLYDCPEAKKHNKNNTYAPKWLCNKVGRCLNARILAAWKQLLHNVDPTVLALQRRIFGVTGHVVNSHILQAVATKHEYFCKDIFNFRAAAHAAVVLRGSEIDESIQRHTPYDDVLWFHYNYDIPLNHWHKLFAYEGKVYGQLLKTLSNLPGRVPNMYLIHRLKNLKLLRPIYDYVELTTLLSSTLSLDALHDDMETNWLNNVCNKQAIFMFATKEQIIKSRNILSKHLRNPIPINRAGLTNLVNYLCDFPEIHNGNIVGLTHKSIAWHRNAQYLQCQKDIPLDTKAKLPPIELPTDPNIKFLATAKDIIDEGQIMGHCVATYAKKAALGKCFLFHIIHDKESATAEITPNGFLSQIRGPYNKDNEACVEGKKILNRWCAKLRRLNKTNGSACSAKEDDWIF